MFLALLVWGCGSNRSPEALPTVSMKIGTKTFLLEVAATPKAQEMGLMRRDSLDPDKGMIFIFPTEKRLPFWMKDTRIPLDVIFLDTSGRVVSVHHMRPYETNVTESDGDARYAIELNRGMAEAANVKAGDQVQIPAGIGQ